MRAWCLCAALLLAASGCALEPEEIPGKVLGTQALSPDDPHAWPAPRFILLIVVDTLRQDHVGAYGSERGLTPALDALAQRSFVFEQAIAPSSWTRSTVAALFTSRYPSSSGVLTREDRLADAHGTLAERLSEAGWATHAIQTNENVGEAFGFAQGFDGFQRSTLRHSYPDDFAMRVGEGVTTEALALLEAHRERSEPFFLYLHYSDPHDPYLPHPALLGVPEPDGRFGGSRRELRRMRAAAARGEGIEAGDRRRIEHLYAGEVKYCDHWIGQLVWGLGASGLLDETLILVTADHGEGLWDHGERGHGVGLHEEQVRVPLLLHYPGMQPGDGVRIGQPVSLVDVTPTLLRAAGLDADPSFEGHDLGPLTRGEERPEAFDYVYSELSLDRHDIESVRTRELKLIRRRGADRALRSATRSGRATQPRHTSKGSRAGARAGRVEPRARPARAPE